MLAEERKQKIMELVREKRIVKVSELSRILSATEATVRRDLEDLQARNQLYRVHGGASAINPTSRMIAQEELKMLCENEKKSIAQEAYLHHLDNYEAIILDGSTTVIELAKCIAAGDRVGLSVITNSFVVAEILATREDIRVVHTGGEVKAILHGCFGVVAEQMIRNVKVEKCFLGTNGIDINYGYSSPTFEEAALKRAILGAAKTRYVLADSTKFGASYMGKFAEFSGDIDIVISDAYPPVNELKQYQEDVNLIIAPSISE